MTDAPVNRPKALPPAIASHTGVVLYKIAQLVQETMDRCLVAQGLRARHHATLSALLFTRPLSQQALADQLRIDRAVMVEVAETLERKGLVERRRNPNDRRVYDISITDEGRRVVAGANAALSAVDDAVFAPLSAADRATLHALLLQLFDSAD